MVLVAVAALALGGWRWIRWRRVHFASLAELHDSHIATSGITTQGVTYWTNKYGKDLFIEYFIILYLDDSRRIETDRRVAEYHRRINANQDWHEAMKRKYLRAAARPWSPVAPDPPEPPLPKGPDDL
jgi:hypothetical protein